MPASHRHIVPLSLLSLLLVAHASVAQDPMARGPVRVPLRKRIDGPASNFKGSGGDLVINSTFASQEVDNLRAKYAKAAQYLKGVGLNVDKHPEKGYKPTAYSRRSDAAFAVAQHRLDGIQGTALPHEVSLDAVRPMPLLGHAPLIDNINGNLDLLYTVEADFGSPPQSLHIDIDTGSADLWVPVNCRSCANDGLNDGMSETYMRGTTKCSMTYGIGAITGVQATEKVSIASLTVPVQTICAARKVSQQINDEPISGLMGLAFGTIGTMKEPTFFENLLSQHSVELPIFSVYMTRKEEFGSELCLGCFNHDKMKPWFVPPVFHPVISRTYWTIAMTAVSVNSKETVPVNLIAAIDTGSTMISLPHDVAKQFYAKNQGSFQARWYMYPCNAELSVALHFNNVAYSVHPSDFVVGKPDQDNSTSCYGAIIGADLAPNFAVVGTHFLKNWYTIFDYIGKVGFAPSINQD
ncbi:aspartic peptidase domain-containing protein [Daedaleopsis nitida]|nr:aspartic peptidase domain-containing protein [Daedaleopsis nitida]